MIKALYAPPGGKAAEVSGEAEIARLVKGAQGCLWVDLEAPTEAERRILSGIFGFHPVAVERCTRTSNYPRLHDYGGYLYLVFHASEGVLPLVTKELDLFLSRHFLLTYHGEALPALAEVRRTAMEVEDLMGRGPDRVLAELLDELADGYSESLEKLSGAVDTVEDRLFKSASRMALRDTFAMKKDVLHLRRIVSPQREIMNRLARGEFKVVSPEEAILFRDVHDRIQRSAEMLESFRDVLTSAMEMYLTVVSNRTNEIVKVLTIVSILLMSVSFVAGLYGMNIPLPLQAEGSQSRAAFWTLLLLMAAIAGGLLLLFRNRRWI